MVKVVQTHRRLDAGEASRGGEPRVLPTGLGLARGAQLRDADARPHPTVVVARPGSGRSGAGDELGGGRSSGASGDGAAVRKRARRGATEALRDAGSALGACPGPNGHGRFTGDECVGGACGWMWCGSYGVRERERRGGAGAGAHVGCDEANGELGDASERAGRRGGSPAAEEEKSIGVALRGPSGRVAQ